MVQMEDTLLSPQTLLKLSRLERNNFCAGQNWLDHTSVAEAP